MSIFGLCSNFIKPYPSIHRRVILSCLRAGSQLTRAKLKLHSTTGTQTKNALGVKILDSDRGGLFNVATGVSLGTWNAEIPLQRGGAGQTGV